ncbi:hypothetical protein Pelo_893 [Pelomyxa schiedti]|nr:hypothetical protein Pelo_893 [Pelomyxa schiedti]
MRNSVLLLAITLSLVLVGRGAVAAATGGIVLPDVLPDESPSERAAKRDLTAAPDQQRAQDLASQGEPDADFDKIILDELQAITDADTDKVLYSFAFPEPKADTTFDVTTEEAVFTPEDMNFMDRFPHHVHTHDSLCPFWSTIVNGDYVAAGVGMRDRSTGTIVISGIPVCSEIQRAFLFWIELSYKNCTPWAAAHVHINGHPIRGSLIGVSRDPCWWTEESYVFAADVTPWVTGNGPQFLSGFPVSGDAPLNEGASLVVVYKRANLPRRAITIYAGANTIDESVSFAYTFLHVPSICNNNFYQSVQTTYIVGDGQTCFSDWAIFDSQFYPNAFDMTEGPYMDTVTIPVTPFVSSGQNTVFTAISRGVDCLTWAAQVFSAPYCGFTNAAPLDPCCSRVRDYIDQIVFVAQERLHTGCLHINDIYQACSECWLQGPNELCGTPCLNPIATIKAEYESEVRAAKGQFLHTCDARNDAMVTIAEHYKGMLTSICSLRQAAALLRAFGEEIEQLIQDVPLTTLQINVFNAGQTALQSSCAAVYDSQICVGRQDQCVVTGPQSYTNSQLSLNDAKYIVDQTVELYANALQQTCH